MDKNRSSNADDETIASPPPPSSSLSPVVSVLLVDFHHKSGPIVEYSTQPLTPENEHGDSDGRVILPDAWHVLPFLALPDGLHKHKEDVTYFTLPDLECEGELVYCAAASQQLDVSKLKEKDASVTRNTVLKAVCVICRLPAYTTMRNALSPCAEVLFAQLDFTNKSILHDVEASLARSLSMKSVSSVAAADTQDFNVSGWLMKLRFVYMQLFKLSLLNTKILIFDRSSASRCEDIGQLVLSLASLLPQSFPTPPLADIPCPPITPSPTSGTSSLHPSGDEKYSTACVLSLPQMLWEYRRTAPAQLSKASIDALVAQEVESSEFDAVFKRSAACYDAFDRYTHSDAASTLQPKATETFRRNAHGNENDADTSKEPIQPQRTRSFESLDVGDADDGKGVQSAVNSLSEAIDQEIQAPFATSDESSGAKDGVHGDHHIDNDDDDGADGNDVSEERSASVVAPNATEMDSTAEERPPTHSATTAVGEASARSVRARLEQLQPDVSLLTNASAQHVRLGTALIAPFPALHGVKPYTALQDADELRSMRAFMAGCANLMLSQDGFLEASLVVDLAGEKPTLKFQSPEIKSAARLTTQDIRFIDGLINHIRKRSEEGVTVEDTDAYVRSQFQSYILHACICADEARETQSKESFAALQEFNREWFNEWRRTAAYAHWCRRSDKISAMYGRRPAGIELSAGHICSGRLKMSDFGRKFRQLATTQFGGDKTDAASMQWRHTVSEGSKALTEAVNVSKHTLSVMGKNIRTWWKTVSAPTSSSTASTTSTGSVSNDGGERGQEQEQGKE